jgi:hypothetical protein
VSGEEYRCAGWTPLYDAVGRGIAVLDEALESKSGRVILVVLTDGMENASREFSHAKITALMKTRQERGWLITFSGEGLDVAKQGLVMGAMAANVAAFAGGQGLRSAGQVMVSQSARYTAAKADIRQAQACAALSREEHDALAGKK